MTMNLTYMPLGCTLGTGGLEFYIIVPPFGANSSNWYVFSLNLQSFIGVYPSLTAAQAAAQVSFNAQGT